MNREKTSKALYENLNVECLALIYLEIAVVCS